MKVEFILNEKSFITKKDQNGNELTEEKTIKYYVLQRKLVDGEVIEIPIKGDKLKLLLMSLRVENNKN